MLFSTIIFIFFFFPLALLCTYLAPARLKNIVLTLFSLFFYFWGEPEYFYLFISVIGFNFLFAFGLEKNRDSTIGKWLLGFCIFANLSVLFMFKYFEFFYAQMPILGVFFDVDSILLSTIHLPLGISFFTFQAISYCADVASGKVRAEKSAVTECVAGRSSI